MAKRSHDILTRRQFLKGTAAVAAASAFGLSPLILTGCKKRGGGSKHRVIVIGFDGMDPGLCHRLMNAGRLPALTKLANAQGYQKLGSSTPPQSPVAWANFINGAGPGSHGLFDFIHRDPSRQAAATFSISETLGGDDGWEVGDHRLHLDFWPFNHTAPETKLLRQGVPFWDHLDKAGISSTFYNLPSNYPASPSRYGNHRCLSGLGTPDLLGEYGTYQLFHDDHEDYSKDSGGRRTFFYFDNGTSHKPLQLAGPVNTILQTPAKTHVEFRLHRDLESQTVGIDLPGQRLMLKPGQWSDWVTLQFTMSMPSFMPDRMLSGICRFYLQSIGPVFRLYVSPINVDPSDPATKISEPSSFVEGLSDKLGLFHTTGFQEAHNARRNDVLTDPEYAHQADFVLEERLDLLNCALDDYDDGLLFFYFSSTDLQSHFFYWDGDGPQPVRPSNQVTSNMDLICQLYERMDDVVADIVKRYGDSATVLVMSDHGFCNFAQEFNLNTWLAENGFLQSPRPGKLSRDADWAGTRAYAIGINGLYVNLKGRERDGSVPPDQKNAVMQELIERLEAVVDGAGQRIIRKVRRADEAYAGPAMALAPDLIVGYSRGFRASWDTALGEVGASDAPALSPNPSSWSADHCVDVAEVPGVLFANVPLAADPTLVDLAPSILTRYGLDVPSAMTGRNILSG